MSVDGLIPESYTAPEKHGLRVPTLRELAAKGAISEGARSVMPSLTYPAHTSIATGVNPGKHGIVSNAAWDPLEKNQAGWRWYAEDIRVPTLWTLAREKGLRTALINWPVTVGAKATANVPEYWRAGTMEDTKIIRALATPGLLEAVVKRAPDFWERYSPPGVKDSSGTDIATYLIETHKPHLLMLHIFEVDHWQHEKGPWSPEGNAAVENADAQLARLIVAAKMAGIWERSVLVVVSDHGFIRYSQRLRPGAYLRQKGLVTLDDRNRITDWKASIVSATGAAFLYVKDKNDEATRKTLLETFAAQAGKPGSGIGRVLTQEQIVAMGGDPEAVLALEPAEGFGFISGYSGDMISPHTGAAGHGFPPDRPEMMASLIFYGPKIATRTLGRARLIDVAPTVAQLLGLPLKETDGIALPVQLKTAKK